jgi:hypothetical protein
MHMIAVGALVVVVVLIALAWFLVIRRLNEGNFETGASFHPPFRKDADREEAPARAWTAGRQLEREEPAPSKGLDQAKDRNVGRSWAG